MRGVYFALILASPFWCGLAFLIWQTDLTYSLFAASLCAAVLVAFYATWEDE